jgi:hypothetical protein
LSRNAASVNPVKVAMTVLVVKVATAATTASVVLAANTATNTLFAIYQKEMAHFSHLFFIVLYQNSGLYDIGIKWTIVILSQQYRFYQITNFSF